LLYRQHSFRRTEVRWFGQATSALPVRRSAAYALATVVLTCCLVCLAPSNARADGDEPQRPTPRTAITIGGASVVLVAAKDRLYAFVDRLDDNAPVEDAELEIDTADGDTIDMQKAQITLNKATAGLFVGPINRVGRQQDAFMVTLKSSVGSGQQPAEIIYTDVIPPPAVMAMVNQRTNIAIAAVSAGLGAITTVLFMLWLRGSRRRVAARPAGTAHAA
jgi:hypothetical protein